MTARKDGKTWTADFYENGRAGRRIRKKGFLTKAAAQRYEAEFFATFKLTGRPLDDRLSDLVTLWPFAARLFVERRENATVTNTRDC
jgi:hypothetical protein